MEKKAKHFIRLLAKKLTEHEHMKKAHGLSQASVAVKQAFKKALNDLPKSELKTELQTNAATYFRKLETLTQNGSSSKIITVNAVGPNGVDGPGQRLQHTQTTTAGPLGPDGQNSHETNRQEPTGSSETVGGPDVLLEVGSTADDEVVPVAGRGAEGADDAARSGEGGRSRRAPADGGLELAYNVYAADAKSRVVGALARLPPATRKRLAPHAYASLRSASSYTEFLQLLQPNGNQGATADTLDLLKEEILASVGSSDDKIFTRCVADCLSGIIIGADRILDLKNMDRLKELQDFILNFLLWAKIQHGVRSIKPANQANAPTNFDDLVAAILSVYIDISIVLARDSPERAEADGRRTLSKVVLLIGHSPVHQLNLLLQVTLPTAQDSRFMLPIYKHMLSRKPAAITNEIFIKYVCAIRFSRDILQHHQPQVLQDILNVARMAEPSKEFLQWLFNISADAYSSLPDAVKIRKVPLVKYLTEQAPKDYLDRLLDIVSDEENESQALSLEDGPDDSPQPPGTSASQEVPAEDVQDSELEGLFFTDTSRDEDLARQVDSDAESIEALHNTLDALMEDIELEESRAQGNIRSAKELSDGPLMPQDGDNQSDYGEREMDTSAATEHSMPETLSFEELRHNSRQERLSKTTNHSGGTKNAKDGSQFRPEKSPDRKNEKALSLSRNGDQDDVLVIPETQCVDSEVESDRESFTTAKDNLDTTKESIVIDIDNEVTFKVRMRHRANGEGREIEGETGEEMESKDDDGQALDDDVEEVDDSNENEIASPKLSPTKTTRSRKSSNDASQEATKKQEQASQEVNGSSQHMCLRSMGTGRNQSSLLRFFTPIRKSGEESGLNVQQTRRAAAEEQLGSDDVEVVPDSCDSADEEEGNPKTDRDDEGVTSRRAKTLEALQEIRGNSQQTPSEKPTSAADSSQKQATAVSGKKHLKRPSRSARKLRSTQRASSSSGSDVDPAVLLSPVIKVDSHSGKRRSTVEDAVSEGIRRIREECVTSPQDLQEPPPTRSAFKLKSSKRNALTITGGVKSKTPGAGTPKRPPKPTESATTPLDKAVAAASERQGVSPLSPSKVKRVATFGDTYRYLAGISADSQTDPGSLPASQSQRATPKKQRLQPKSLGEMFSAATPRSQRPGAKKGTADVQPLSGSSQESSKSGRGNNSSSVKKQRTKKSPSQSSQESPVSQKKVKKSKATEAKESDSDGLLGEGDGDKASLKRRASLPASKFAKTSAKMRKSTGGKT